MEGVDNRSSPYPGHYRGYFSNARFTAADHHQRSGSVQGVDTPPQSPIVQSVRPGSVCTKKRFRSDDPPALLKAMRPQLPRESRDLRQPDEDCTETQMEAEVDWFLSTLLAIETVRCKAVNEKGDKLRSHLYYLLKSFKRVPIKQSLNYYDQITTIFRRF